MCFLYPAEAVVCKAVAVVVDSVLAVGFSGVPPELFCQIFVRTTTRVKNCHRKGFFRRV